MVVPLAMQLYRIVMVTDDYWALVQGRVVLRVEWLFDVSLLESLQSDLMGWLCTYRIMEEKKGNNSNKYYYL